MGPYAPKGTDKHFDWNDLKATVFAWQFWAFAAQYLAVRFFLVARPRQSRTPSPDTS